MGLLRLVIISEVKASIIHLLTPNAETLHMIVD